MTTDEDAPLRGFVAAAAAHDVNANGRFALHAVVHALEPMIEPALLERIEVDGRIRGELRLSGVAYARTAVSPGTDDEPLRALLVLAQSGEVQVRHLTRPRSRTNPSRGRRGCPCSRRGDRRPRSPLNQRSSN